MQVFCLSVSCCWCSVNCVILCMKVFKSDFPLMFSSYVAYWPQPVSVFSYHFILGFLSFQIFNLLSLIHFESLFSPCCKAGIPFHSFAFCIYISLKLFLKASVLILLSDLARCFDDIWLLHFYTILLDCVYVCDVCTLF